MGEHGLIRQYLFSALFSTHGRRPSRVVLPPESAVVDSGSKEAAVGAPIPSRARVGHAYGYQWVPDFFAWLTRHQSGNDRVSTDDDCWLAKHGLCRNRLL